MSSVVPRHPALACEFCGHPFPYRVDAGKTGRFCSWACLERSRDPVTRFWSKVDKNGPIPKDCPELGTCWIWRGAVFSKSDYGQFWMNYRNRRAHIVSYEWALGVIPTGQQIQHLCNVRLCVRPTHLSPGTPTENMQYASTFGRMPHGERHHKAKITADDVREIRWMAAQGVPQTQLALSYGVGTSTVHSIIHRQTWRHVL